MKVPCKITLEGDKACARNFMGAAQSQMQILENQMSFQKLKQGARRVQLTPRIRIEARVCFSLREVIVYCKPKVQKLLEKKFEKLPKLYVYVTISDYVIIWDLLTGELAEDVCNNEGKIHDNNGDLLITFPCHKDKLVTWLEGIQDRPTRQVLKDEPEDNRDYLEDNEQDAGNESRIKSSSLKGFGFPQTVDYTHIIGTNVFDCSTCPDSEAQVIDEIAHGPVYSPSDVSIQTPGLPTCESATLGTCWPVCETCGKWNVDCKCFWDRRTEKDRPGGSLDFENSWCKNFLGHWYHLLDSGCCDTGFRPCWCNHRQLDVSVNIYHGFVAHDNVAKFLERWRWRCKNLILNPRNIAGWTASETDGMTCALTRISFEVTHRDSAFGYIYARHRICRRLEGRTHSYVMSYKTVLGDLILDFIPARKLREHFADLNDYQQLNITLRDSSVDTWVSNETKFDEDYLSDTFVENYVDAHIATNELPPELGEYLKNSFPLGDPEDIYFFGTGDGRLPRASFKRAIYTGSGDSPGSYTQHAIKANKTMGEIDIDDRFAVSWCECPNKKSWYKVRLFFYTGKVKYSKLTQLYCPANLKHMRHIDWCNDGEYSEYYIGERFSSVQATIELESPKDYKKEKTSIPGKSNWVERYRRPGDYSKLGVFPGRESGYPEDGAYCYPFDGTYDIYTLGEAVEELINNHYVDGSNDQLLVYLYERPDMIEKEKEEK